MNILIHIFQELDRATCAIARNVGRETIKAGKRILVKAHRRKGKRVEGHTRIIRRTTAAKGRRPRRRTVTVAQQGNYKRNAQAGTRRKRA